MLLHTLLKLEEERTQKDRVRLLRKHVRSLDNELQLQRAKFALTAVSAKTRDRPCAFAGLRAAFRIRVFLQKFGAPENLQIDCATVISSLEAHIPCDSASQIERRDASSFLDSTQSDAPGRRPAVQCAEHAPSSFSGWSSQSGESDSRGATGVLSSSWGSDGCPTRPSNHTLGGDDHKDMPDKAMDCRTAHLCQPLPNGDGSGHGRSVAGTSLSSWRLEPSLFHGGDAPQQYQGCSPHVNDQLRQDDRASKRQQKPQLREQGHPRIIAAEEMRFPCGGQLSEGGNALLPNNFPGSRDFGPPQDWGARATGNSFDAPHQSEHQQRQQHREARVTATHCAAAEHGPGMTGKTAQQQWAAGSGGNSSSGLCGVAAAAGDAHGPKPRSDRGRGTRRWKSSPGAAAPLPRPPVPHLPLLTNDAAPLRQTEAWGGFPTNEGNTIGCTNVQPAVAAAAATSSAWYAYDNPAFEADSQRQDACWRSGGQTGTTTIRLRRPSDTETRNISSKTEEVTAAADAMAPADTGSGSTCCDGTWPPLTYLRSMPFSFELAAAASAQLLQVQCSSGATSFQQPSAAQRHGPWPLPPMHRDLDMAPGPTQHSFFEPQALPPAPPEGVTLSETLPGAARCEGDDADEGWSPAMRRAVAAADAAAAAVSSAALALGWAYAPGARLPSPDGRPAAPSTDATFGAATTVTDMTTAFRLHPPSDDTARRPVAQGVGAGAEVFLAAGNSGSALRSAAQSRSSPGLGLSRMLSQLGAGGVWGNLDLAASCGLLAISDGGCSPTASWQQRAASSGGGAGAAPKAGRLAASGLATAEDPATGGGGGDGDGKHHADVADRDSVTVLVGRIARTRTHGDDNSCHHAASVQSTLIAGLDGQPTWGAANRSERLQPLDNPATRQPGKPAAAAACGNAAQRAGNSLHCIHPTGPSRYNIHGSDGGSSTASKDYNNSEQGSDNGSQGRPCGPELSPLRRGIPNGYVTSVGRHSDVDDAAEAMAGPLSAVAGKGVPSDADKATSGHAGSETRDVAVVIASGNPPVSAIPSWESSEWSQDDCTSQPATACPDAPLPLPPAEQQKQQVLQPPQPPAACWNDDTQQQHRSLLHHFQTFEGPRQFFGSVEDGRFDDGAHRDEGRIVSGGGCVDVRYSTNSPPRSHTGGSSRIPPPPGLHFHHALHHQQQPLHSQAATAPQSLAPPQLRPTPVRDTHLLAQGGRRGAGAAGVQLSRSDPGDGTAVAAGAIGACGGAGRVARPRPPRLSNSSAGGASALAAQSPQTPAVTTMPGPGRDCGKGQHRRGEGEVRRPTAAASVSPRSAGRAPLVRLPPRRTSILRQRQAQQRKTRLSPRPGALQARIDPETAAAVNAAAGAAVHGAAPSVAAGDAVAPEYAPPASTGAFRPTRRGCSRAVAFMSNGPGPTLAANEDPSTPNHDGDGDGSYRNSQSVEVVEVSGGQFANGTPRQRPPGMHPADSQTGAALASHSPWEHAHEVAAAAMAAVTATIAEGESRTSSNGSAGVRGSAAALTAVGCAGGPLTELPSLALLTDLWTPRGDGVAGSPGSSEESFLALGRLVGSLPGSVSSYLAGALASAGLTGGSGHYSNGSGVGSVAPSARERLQQQQQQLETPPLAASWSLSSVGWARLQKDADQAASTLLARVGSGGSYYHHLRGGDGGSGAAGAAAIASRRCYGSSRRPSNGSMGDSVGSPRRSAAPWFRGSWAFDTPTARSGREQGAEPRWEKDRVMAGPCPASKSVSGFEGPSGRIAGAERPFAPSQDLLLQPSWNAWATESAPILVAGLAAEAAFAGDAAAFITEPAAQGASMSGRAQLPLLQPSPQPQQQRHSGEPHSICAVSDDGEGGRDGEDDSVGECGSSDVAPFASANLAATSAASRLLHLLDEDSSGPSGSALGGLPGSAAGSEASFARHASEGAGADDATTQIDPDVFAQVDATNDDLLHSQRSAYLASPSLGFSPFATPRTPRSDGGLPRSLGGADGPWEATPEANWRNAADALGSTPYDALYEFKGASDTAAMHSGSSITSTSSSRRRRRRAGDGPATELPARSTAAVWPNRKDQRQDGNRRGSPAAAIAEPAQSPQPRRSWFGRMGAALVSSPFPPSRPSPSPSLSPATSRSRSPSPLHVAAASVLRSLAACTARSRRAADLGEAMALLSAGQGGQGIASPPFSAAVLDAAWDRGSPPNDAEEAIGNGAHMATQPWLMNGGTVTVQRGADGDQIRQSDVIMTGGSGTRAWSGPG